MQSSCARSSDHASPPSCGITGHTSSGSALKESRQTSWSNSRASFSAGSATDRGTPPGRSGRAADQFVRCVGEGLERPESERRSVGGKILRVGDVAAVLEEDLTDALGAIRSVAHDRPGLRLAHFAEVVLAVVCGRPLLFVAHGPTIFDTPQCAKGGPLRQAVLPWGCDESPEGSPALTKMAR